MLTLSTAAQNDLDLSGYRGTQRNCR